MKKLMALLGVIVLTIIVVVGMVQIGAANAAPDCSWEMCIGVGMCSQYASCWCVAFNQLSNCQDVCNDLCPIM